MLYIPKKTIERIRQKGHHYLVRVKQNQPNLYRDIASKIEQVPLSSYTQQDNSHGRKVTRTTRVYAVTNCEVMKNWKDLSTYIIVERSRKTKKEHTHELAYLISDMNWQAEQFHEAIKNHWQIENCLHWVKDVVHKEDKNKIRTASGPICASVFSAIAINFHRKNKHKSITNGQILFRANVKELFNMIRT